MRKLFVLLVFVVGSIHTYAQTDEIKKLEQEVYDIGELGKTNRDSAMQLAIDKLSEARELRARYAEAKLKHNIIIGLKYLGKIDEAIDSIYATRNLIAQWITEASVDSVVQNLKLVDTNIYYDLGLTLMNMGEIDKAIQIFTECITSYQSLNIDSIKIKNRVAYCNSSLGIAQVRLGNTDAAIEKFEESIKMSKETNDRYGLITGHMYLGNLLVNKDRFKDALNTFFTGLKIVQEDSSYIMGAYYVNIGRVYKNLRDYEQAISFTHKSYSFSLENNDKKLQTYVAITLGEYYMDINEYDSAQQHMMTGLQLAKETQNPGEQSRALRTLAELAVKQSMFQEALSWINQGNLVLAKRPLPSYEMRLKIIEAECLFELNELSKAKLSIDRAIELASKTNDINIIRDVYERAHKIYWALGQKNTAYNYLLEFNTAQDSIYNEEKSLEIARLEYDYQLKNETERLELEKQQQAALYENELEKERLIQLAAFGGVLLTSIILIVLYRSNQTKKRKNKQLSEKNIEISNLREKEKNLAQETIALKERELTTITMLSHERNSLLQQLGDQIGGLSDKVDEEVIPDLKEIKKTIKANLSDESWSAFVYHFEKVHPKLFDELQSRFPSLTQNDLRLCAYIRVGMDRKEMATVSNVTPEAIKKSLYRLKKKMNLDADTDIRDFLIAMH